MTTIPRMTTRVTSALSTTIITAHPSYRRPIENFLKAAYDLIPENDRKSLVSLLLMRSTSSDRLRGS
jgi:hypothetical protein